MKLRELLLARRRSTAVIASAVLAVTAGVAGAASGPKMDVGRYLKPPTSIGITKPLSKPAPKSKFIVAVACNLPTCKLFFDAGKEAAKALGWRFQSVTTTGAPEDLIKKFEYALSLKPDGIFTSGFSRATFESALKQAIDQKVPVVTSGVPDATKPPYVAVTTSTPYFVQAGKLLSNWIVADSGNDAHVAVFNVPLFPILDAAAKSIDSTVKGLCPSCSVKIVNQQLSDIGTKLPSNVISTIQANPKINYLVFEDGNFAAGVSAALSDAGLSSTVKVVGLNGGPTNLANILNGSETAYLGYSNAWVTWAGFDSLARYFVGDKAQSDPLAAPIQILTKQNLKSAAAWNPPGYKAQFMKLWKGR